MGGMSKLALGTTITVALIFALFLTLFLLLLADFVSSLLRTRTRKHTPNVNLEAPNQKSSPNFHLKDPSLSPLSKPAALPSFYAHGVLQAPTSFLLTVPKLEAAAAPPIIPTSPVSMCSMSGAERFVCISNPVYDGVQIQIQEEEEEEEEENGVSSTPFETPGTSPSHFGEEGEWSPPLGFMKKLPPVRQWLPGMVSASDTNRASTYSFSSSTLCFSPSW
ncbi:hypothetical protein LUZ62_080088 [Rhynchospora pubera]|uniref:Uncharacterized protein n=1 Tax=Rhynchospora pubera TaxID=906938 RepID=A0AAV8BRE2_9POAL|nr:hypothetical protein LUZ62_080088 [Rhynchospora pubera]